MPPIPPHVLRLVPGPPTGTWARETCPHCDHDVEVHVTFSLPFRYLRFGCPLCETWTYYAADPQPTAPATDTPK